MMPKEKLQSRVRDKKLTISHIISPPRCMSTVLEFAIGDLADGQINEPFHIQKRNDLDEVASKILKRNEELRKGRGDSGINLVIKDLANHLSHEEWLWLCGVISFSIFIFREPTQWLNSLVSLRVNDLIHPDRNGLSSDEISEASESLKPEEWFNPSWQRMMGFLQLAENYDNSLPPMVLISALGLLDDPFTTLNAITQSNGWVMEKDAKVGGWEFVKRGEFHNPNFDGDGYQSIDEMQESSWLRVATSNNSFLPLNEKSHGMRSMEQFTPFMQEYLLYHIFPAYTAFMMHEKNISKPPFLRLIGASDSISLAQINPLEAFILAHSYQDLTSVEKQQQRKFIERMRVEVEAVNPGLIKVLMPLIAKEQLCLNNPVFSTKSNKPECLVLSGITCSGKTTWANKFIRANKDKKYALISRERIRDEVYREKHIDKSHTPSHEIESLAKQRFEEELQKLVKAGANIIIDDSNATLQDRRVILNSAHSTHQTAIITFPMSGRVAYRLQSIRQEEDKLNNDYSHLVLPESTIVRMESKYKQPTTEEGFNIFV